jgi:UDP-galactopyranose mutase
MNAPPTSETWEDGKLPHGEAGEFWDIVVVGAGLSGAVLAERFASSGYTVLVLEKRDHIGGNCYDYIDAETGIRVNKYGAHIFHTQMAHVWDYVQRFRFRHLSPPPLRTRPVSLIHTDPFSLLAPLRLSRDNTMTVHAAPGLMPLLAQ